MLSSVLTPSTPGVVIAIENRTQNVDKQSKFWFCNVSALLSVVCPPPTAHRTYLEPASARSVRPHCSLLVPRSERLLVADYAMKYRNLSKPNFRLMWTFGVRFSMAVTTPGVLAVSTELNVHSESSKRSCEQLYSHRRATRPRGLKERFHDSTPVVRPTDELQTSTHIA